METGEGERGKEEPAAARRSSSGRGDGGGDPAQEGVWLQPMELDDCEGQGGEACGGGEGEREDAGDGGDEGGGDEGEGGARTSDRRVEESSGGA